MGSITGERRKSHASATWAGVARFRAATWWSSSTKAWFALRFSAENLGTALRKSVASNVAQGLQLGTDLTGIDLTALLSRLGGRSSEPDNGRVEPAEPKKIVEAAPKK